MNDAELDQKLKAARGPALDPEYVDDFARQVLANLHFKPQKAGRASASWRPRLAWGLATAACILVAFIIGHKRGQNEAQHDVLASAKVVEETLAMFPNRVRAIVQDERGMNLVLSDQPDVPASPPIYVRICDGENCSSLVTFSGQEIQIAGQQLTILADASGGVILEGNKFVWSSSEPGKMNRNLKIHAKMLQPTAL